MVGVSPENVTRPEHPARLVVTARSDDEARARAWIRWYGRPPRNELELLTREKATVIDGPTVMGGRIAAPDGPGIGAVPMLDVIGSPIAIYE